MKRYTYAQEQWVPASLDDVFQFFSDAGNLERITPPWLRFRVIAPKPIQIEEGTLIDYKLRIRGIPMRWQSEITQWNPPYSFVDEQRRGPYRLWVHEHTFEEHDGGVLTTDRVEYAVPGGRIVHGLFVKRDIERIFEYRRAVLERLFAPDGDFENRENTARENGIAVR